MGADIPASHAAGSASDDELVAAARQGDSTALETLLVRYQAHLHRFGLRMCGNVEDAGDVAQESLISMARSVRDFRGDSSVFSWLYTAGVQTRNDPGGRSQSRNVCCISR